MHKKFKFPFGSGIIPEQAQIVNDHWEPTIQYLEFTEGPAKGTKALRFCVYAKGKFLRNCPMVMSAEDRARMGKKIKQNRHIHGFLKKLVE